ncbi:zinc ribbon domain-containing protein [uncultured Parolsenella sp.]|uniref:zinc ribbon domain-containing protein n=1 Tax=uncultured Parolsenella sp. TaxID=2083008 RepID=UPI0025D5A173|nr:zinc ribbon domain-containing protein [uncultured Parolsenella sp.]
MANGTNGNKMEEAQRKVLEWARGRNGADELSGACTTLAVILVIIDLFAHTTWVSVMALVLLGYSWFRITSKDVSARSRENAQVLKAAGPVISFLANPAAELREAKNYVHLACPSCGQRVRIPRGKGTVRITCPKCHTRFDGKA